MAAAASSWSSTSVGYVTVGMLVLHLVVPTSAGVISSYARRRSALQTDHDMPLDSDVFRAPPGFNAPQQVHITQGDYVGKGVLISWITPVDPGLTSVVYWKDKSTAKHTVEGIVTNYTYYNYASGYIHHSTLTNLEYRTKYYYRLGEGVNSRKFWFVTPPKPGPDVPYTFGVIGDLGQTPDSNRTLEQYQKNPAGGQTVLYVGDLSYADKYPNGDNGRWDTWGRFIERDAAYQPWIWSVGDHDLDYAPDLGEREPFKPFTHRYPVPYQVSRSSEPLWYAIKRASAYIIVLSSYSAYARATPQYQWLEKEFKKVNRSETPWLIVVMHAPFYSSYVNHYMEGEAMRSTFEKWFNKYRVDVVFAGHIHAYERFERVSNVNYNITNGHCKPVKNLSSPVYITIGDGGNLEGLDTKYPLVFRMYRQPSYSTFREASYGHGIFDIKNRSHAHFSWFRNNDGKQHPTIQSDGTWLLNRHNCGPVNDTTASCPAS